MDRVDLLHLARIRTGLALSRAVAVQVRAVVLPTIPMAQVLATTVADLPDPLVETKVGTLLSDPLGAADLASVWEVSVGA
jgi:hypothetical protein